MKKFVSLSLILLLVFSLAGCETTNQMKDRLNSRIPRGTINGNVYTSEFTGITFTKPDKWSYLSDEKISEYMGISIESLDANYFEKQEMHYSNIIDMIAVDNGVGVSVSIGYENLSLTTGRSLSEEEYISATIEYLETLSDTIVGETESVTISGEEYLKVSFITDTNNVEIETSYCVRLIGDIMTIVNISSPLGIVDRNVDAMFS